MSALTSPLSEITPPAPDFASVRRAMPRGRDWLAFVRPGDWLTLLACAALIAILFVQLADRPPVDRAVIRRDGATVAEVMLAVHKQIPVEGPLGTTIIEIVPGKARVLSDPGARQLCVQQGWLDKANATALCLPNRVSLQVVSSSSRHDSLSY